MNAPRVVIAGAGVIGVSLAYELSQQGAGITLLERDLPGRQASWAGAGILTPARLETARTPLDRLRAYSLERIERWSADLLRTTGIDNGFRRSGALELAFSAEDETALAASAARWREQGVEVHEVAPDELRQLEPALAGAVRRANLLPGEAQIRNPRHLQALLAACEQQGVAIRTATPATRIVASGGRVERLATSPDLGGDSFPGDIFVITAGPWSAEVLASAGVELQLRPVRGQIVLLQCAAPPFRRILWQGDRYLVPRDDGRVLIGSTSEDAGFDAVPTAAGVRELLEFGQRLVPALAEAPFERAWAGLRPCPAGDDRLPYIAAVPGYSNLYVATGHFRAGFELSAGTAMLAAELVLGRTPSVPPADFGLER